MAEDELIGEIDSFLQANETAKNEEPLRASFQEIAKTQLRTIDLRLFDELTTHFQGKGLTNQLGKLFPDFLGDDKKYIDSVIERLRLRIPEEIEAARLVEAVLSGQPAFTKKDGTIIVTSFQVGEPSNKDFWSRSKNLGDNKDDLSWVTNVNGTEDLIARILSRGLPFSPKGTFTTEVKRPEKFDAKSPNKTAYTPRVRTLFTPTPAQSSA